MISGAAVGAGADDLHARGDQSGGGDLPGSCDRGRRDRGRRGGDLQDAVIEDVAIGGVMGVVSEAVAKIFQGAVAVI